ncbi:MAG: hypothetical protein ACUVWO_01560 [Thermodesulfobacteriota bacterium]
MKTKGLILFSLLFLLGFASSSFSAENACIKCHADEATMKSLFKPPKVSAEEGEG